MNVKEKVEQRVRLNEQSKAIWDKADGEKRALTPEEHEKIKALQGDINALRDEIEGEAQRTEEQRRLRQAYEDEQRALSESRGRRTETSTREGSDQPTDEERELAFRGWCLGPKASESMRQAAQRCNMNIGLPFIDMGVRVRMKDGVATRTWLPVEASSNMDIVGEKRALSVGTTTAGGNAVPNEMMRAFYEVQKWFARFPEECLNINTETGATLPWPTVTDTANSARVLAEATTATTTTDPTFGVVNLGAFKASSDAVLVSWELLQDSFIDIAGYLGTALGRRIARHKNTKATVGAGTTEPKGVIPGATVGVTAASSTAFTADEVIDLIHSLDPAYRNLPGVAVMFHDTIAKTVRKFKDGQGRYLWEMSTQVGQPDRLFGFPVIINNDMASALTTGQKIMAIGHYLSAFIVRTAGAVRFIRADELKVLEHQVVFEASQRWDSNIIDATAVKVLALG